MLQRTASGHLYIMKDDSVKVTKFACVMVRIIVELKDEPLFNCVTESNTRFTNPKSFFHRYISHMEVYEPR